MVIHRLKKKKHRTNLTINVEYYDYNTLIETKSINCMILSNAVKQFKNNNNSVVDVNQRKKRCYA